MYTVQPKTTDQQPGVGGVDDPPRSRERDSDMLSRHHVLKSPSRLTTQYMVIVLRPACPASPLNRQLTRAHPNWESSVLEAANQLHGLHITSQSAVATLINPARRRVTALTCMQSHIGAQSSTRSAFKCWAAPGSSTVLIVQTYLDPKSFAMVDALPAPPPLPALPAPPVVLTFRERLAEFKSLEEKRNQLIEVRTETCLRVVQVRLTRRPTGADRQTRKDRGQAHTNRT